MSRVDECSAICHVRHFQKCLRFRSRDHLISCSISEHIAAAKSSAYRRTLQYSFLLVGIRNLLGICVVEVLHLQYIFIVVQREALLDSIFDTFKDQLALSLVVICSVHDSWCRIQHIRDELHFLTLDIIDCSLQLRHIGSLLHQHVSVGSAVNRCHILRTLPVVDVGIEKLNEPGIERLCLNVLLGYSSFIICLYAFFVSLELYCLRIIFPGIIETAYK